MHTTLDHSPARNGPAKTAVAPQTYPVERQTEAFSVRCMQTTYGNRSVQGWLGSAGAQAKLAVSQPGDRWEQEAERIAEIVVGNPSPATTAPALPISPHSTAGRGPALQRQPASPAPADPVLEELQKMTDPSPPPRSPLGRMVPESNLDPDHQAKVLKIIRWAMERSIKNHLDPKTGRVDATRYQILEEAHRHVINDLRENSSISDSSTNLVYRDADHYLVARKGSHDFAKNVDDPELRAAGAPFGFAIYDIAKVLGHAVEAVSGERLTPLRSDPKFPAAQAGGDEWALLGVRHYLKWDKSRMDKHEIPEMPDETGADRLFKAAMSTYGEPRNPWGKTLLPDTRLFRFSKPSESRTVNPESPILATNLPSSRGQPLEASTRASMEQRFGYDFTSVRVHADPDAAECARSVKALAYTTGRDIFFDTGQYSPQSTAGRRLLAHELAHVVQQNPALGAPRSEGAVPARPALSLPSAVLLPRGEAETKDPAAFEGLTPPAGGSNSGT